MILLCDVIQISSKLIQDAVNAFSKLPGIGEKTALRLVLQLLKNDIADVEAFGNAIVNMRKNIRFCKKCFNISDEELCNVCMNPNRDPQLVCVVENIRDAIALENTEVYFGSYHVLGGVISPVDGIGVDQLHIEALLQRIEADDVKELVMALNPTMEGDTTIFYIAKRLEGKNVKITSIARGVSFGGELEYTDELTLARSLSGRQPFENYLSSK